MMRFRGLKNTKYRSGLYGGITPRGLQFTRENSPARAHTIRPRPWTLHSRASAGDGLAIRHAVATACLLATDST
jgi:hypothetical protein